MAVNSEDLILSWKNVSAWITKQNLTSKNTLKVLDNVCGIAKSGSLVAVLSPSGAGKTTLLAALNKRFKGLVEGDILVNGFSVKQKQMSRISGFVPQKDFAFEVLTVYEHLEFMARLKMGANVTSGDRQKTIMKVVEHLSLTHRIHVKLSALSGGQRKRLALAVQLLTEPRVLFCDEPTTGLDSYSATNVIKLLRLLANEGRIVLCSIHQPTSGIFEMFDYVSLLASGGALAYYGKVNGVLDHFRSLGLECPITFNTAEFLVNKVTVINNGLFLHKQDPQDKVNYITRSFLRCSDYNTLMSELTDISSQKVQRLNSTDGLVDKVPFYTEFNWLLWRTTVLTIRSYRTIVFRFLTYLVVMLAVSVPYGRIRVNQIGIQNIQGLLHTAMLEILYCSLYGIIFTFPDEMPIFLQDSADYVYSPISYYLSKILILFPRSVLESFIYANIVYSITGVSGSLVSLQLSLPMIMVSVVASAYGFFLSTTFENINTASLFSVPFELVCCIFAGIFLRLRSLPGYVQWIKYLSFIYYSYEALSIQQWVKHKYIPCEFQVCFSTGDEVLELYGFNKYDLFTDYIGLVIMFLLFHIFGFLFLLRRRKYAATY